MLVYTIAELDALFGYAPQKGHGSWWAHNWQRMVAEHAFPAPLPGFGRPRWSRALVDRWANTNGADTGEPVKFVVRPEGVRPPELEPNLAALDRAR